MGSEMIAIIPARGGSKRLPRKNIRAFAGRPMIEWTIAAARESGRFAHVIVSTDDREIAEIARLAGAEVPFLRAIHADDLAPISSASLAALDQAESHYGQEFPSVVQLMPNCPLRRARHIGAAIDHFVERRHEFQISAARYGWLNPWWAHRLREEDRPEPLFPDEMKARSQDLPALYCPTGAIWIARSAALRRAGSFYGPGYRLCEIEWRAAVDIDDEDDFRLAEALSSLGDS